jgi:D-alanyl-D-alanine carboxypeptidase
MRLVPAIIIAMALVLAPVLWIGLNYLVFQQEEIGGSSVDSTARIEVEILRQQVEDLQARLTALENQVARSSFGAGGAFRPDPDDPDQALRETGPNEIIDAYAQVMVIANRRNLNPGLAVASPAYLVQMLGRPRDSLSDDCQPMTNQALADKLVTEQVGPIRVRMLAPAVASLRRVLATIRRADPDLYDRITSAGALCVRRIRGSENSLSSHSFGLAVDLNIDGRLDTLGDGRTQLGLTILADFFNSEGWVWGAAFGREDSMHFEVSRKQLDQWLADGSL